jgi:ankyrin repeat protein
MTRILIVLITAIFPAWLWAEDSAPDVHQLDFSKAWFKPYLVHGEGAVCNSVLDSAREVFFTSGSYDAAYFSENHKKNIQGLSDIIKTKRSIWRRNGDQISGGEDDYLEITRGGKTFWLETSTNPGCGGACETPQLNVKEVFFGTEFIPSISMDGQVTKKETSVENDFPAGDFRVFIDAETKPHILIVGAGHEERDRIFVFDINEYGKTNKECEIQLAAKKEDFERLKILIDTQKSIAELEAAFNKIIGGAGSCGSMATHFRMTQWVHENLQEALFRPWVLAWNESNRSSHANDMTAIEQWGMTGVYEHNALSNHKEKMQLATESLIRFYNAVYGWPINQARAIAEESLHTAISSGLIFGQYDPFPTYTEKSWKEAILNKAPEDILKSLPVEESIKNVIPESFGGEKESLLNVAISYPVALKILLEKGLNPNNTNAFGKTPLMYAAQYNELESAKMLLEHDADANAATIKPSDNCYYTLQTLNMTPLHYAVRYASPEFVKLLLDHGAEPFIKARNERLYPAKEETPLDWLHRYTAADAPEKNPNIPADKVAGLELLLKLPEAAELASVAAKAILQAEKDFQEGNTKSAYRLLKKALNLQPENERALSDMSLVALKQGEVGPSLEASEKLIKTSKDDQLKANAWFNQGLACENNNSSYYNGHSYCKGGTTYPYTQALALKPTAARQKKLLDVLQAGESCQLLYQDKNINLMRGYMPDPAGSYYSKRLIYVLHENGQALHVEDFSWDQKMSHGSHITPALQATYPLGDKTLTVLNIGDVDLLFPYSVGNWTCKDGKSPAVPKDTTAPTVH